MVETMAKNTPKTYGRGAISSEFAGPIRGSVLQRTWKAVSLDFYGVSTHWEAACLHFYDAPAHLKDSISAFFAVFQRTWRQHVCIFTVL